MSPNEAGFDAGRKSVEDCAGADIAKVDFPGLVTGNADVRIWPMHRTIIFQMPCMSLSLSDVVLKPIITRICHIDICWLGRLNRRPFNLKVTPESARMFLAFRQR